MEDSVKIARTLALVVEYLVKEDIKKEQHLGPAIGLLLDLEVVMAGKANIGLLKEMATLLTNELDNTKLIINNFDFPERNWDYNSWRLNKE
jgi:hypothetical protein